MSIKAIHHANGLMIVKTEDEDHVTFDLREAAGADTNQPGGSPQAPKEKDPKEAKPPPPVEIVLGPLPKPPLPLGVVVVAGEDNGSYGGDSPFKLKLDTAIEHGTFSDPTVQAIRKAVAVTKSKEHLTIDAFLPANHLIDLGLLSRHVEKLGAQVGRPIEMRVRTTAKAK
jgi:hypothetical protein